MQKASVAYMQTQITTTNQGELLLMLYAGAIKFLLQAREEIEKKNYAEKGMLISKAMDIIAELDGSLNMEKGGELSKNLHQLYMFCNSHLLKASIKMSGKMVDEVVNILEGLRSAYAQVINTPEAIAALNEAPAQTISESAPRTTGNRMFADTAPLQTPTGPAAMGISARAQSAAYMQQAQAAQAPTAAPAAAQAPDAAPAPAAQQMPGAPADFAAQSAADAGSGPQAGTQAAATALNALAAQAKPAAPAAANPEPQEAAPLVTPVVPAGLGFARQVTGNALYRKMSGQA